MLEIQTLGDLSIRMNGKAVSGLASRKADALLVYLAVTQQMQPREYLAALLWDEEQERAQGNLRVVLSSLRKELPSYIDIRRDKVGLLPQANIQVDVYDLLNSNATPSDPTSFDDLQSALDLYQGPFLLSFNIRNAPLFENWMTLEREHFRSVFDNKFQQLLDCLLDGGYWQDAVRCGEDWLARTRRGYVPENAYRALMRAYAGMGNISGLSSIYQRCIQYLNDEIGVDPSEQTQELYVKLLGSRRPEAAAGVKQPDALISPEADAARLVLNRWRASKAETIDMAGLSLVYASLGELLLDKDECALIIRSVLHHGLDVRAWVESLQEPDRLVDALERCLDCYEQTYVRLQIVDALKTIPGERAAQVLSALTLKDSSVEVRAEAALAVRALGEGELLTQQLAAELQEKGNTAAVAPLVALVDAGESLPKLDVYPNLMVWMGVVKQRWRNHREKVRLMTWRSLIVAAIISLIHGSTAPLHVYFISVEDYLTTLKDMNQTPFAWALSGAVGYLLIGGVQGFVSGFTIGVADAITLRNRSKWRLLAGGVSGLVYALIVMVFVLVGFTDPTRGWKITIPVLLIYGFLFGTGLSFVYPPLGELRSRSQQLLRALLVIIGLSIATILQVFAVHPYEPLEILPNRLAFVILFPIAMALGFSKTSDK